MANPFILGLRALWRTWTEPDFAQRLDPLLAGGTLPAPAVPAPAAPAVPAPTPTPPPAVAPAPVRSDALALLAVLQREGRFLDFLEEPVDSYSDAEVGVAVRSLHKECGAAIRRMFGLQPLVTQEEGTTVDIPAGHDPAQWQLVGGKAGAAAVAKGTLVHPGWKATRADLPAWTGREESARVLAPAEVEIK